LKKWFLGCFGSESSAAQQTSSQLKAKILVQILRGAEFYSVFRNLLQKYLKQKVDIFL
jgi:hypothetical protein